MVDRLLRWRRFPGSLQWAGLAATLVVVSYAFQATRHAEVNPSAALVWQIWWPLLPFTVIIGARLWCAICPFPAIGDAAQRLRGSTLPLPPPIVRRHGVWVGSLSLALLGVVFLALSLETNARLTAGLLLLFTGAAIVTALLWRGRAWCRYLCPLGLLLGLYSHLAWLRLAPAGDRRQVARASRGCPVFTSPFSRRSSRDCVVCTVCLKADEGHSLTAQLRPPSLTWLARNGLPPAEAVAVALLLGLLLADTVRMTPLYLRYTQFILPLVQGNYEWAMVTGIVASVMLVLTTHVALALAVGRGRKGLRVAFGRLALVYLPIALALHLALSAQHLLAVDSVVRSVLAEIEVLSPGHMPPADAYGINLLMKGLQLLMLVGGVAGAAYLSRRAWPARRALPTVASAVAPAVLAIPLFGLPMSITC